MPNKQSELKDPREWVKDLDIESTEDIAVPKMLVDQVIGQKQGVEIVRKAAEQKRHVMLIGDPGTGKSMLAKSMSELLPKEELQDVLVYHNQEDNNEPRVRVVPSGKGKEIVQVQKAQAMIEKEKKAKSQMLIVFTVVGFGILWFITTGFSNPMIIFYSLIAAAFIFMAMRYTNQRNDTANVPKGLVLHKYDAEAAFVDATGAHAGALLGDVRHDPFQSGGLETPAHDRVEAGAIHKAHRGVLYIDEINLLRMESQQALLTAIQEGEFSISGQSERSAGAMTKTEPVPCDFVLVAAGNLDAIQGMHPALRSRIRGYGYEVYMNSTIPDSQDNREKLVRFIAQEVAKDEKIGHFSKGAIGEVIHEAQRRAGRQNHLSLRLRELGGLVRVAGDVSRELGENTVTAEHVMTAKTIAKPLEQQIADRYVERRKDYKTYSIKGSEIGMVNGLAVMGANSGMAEMAGILMPIVAEVTPAQYKNHGRVIATGKLGDIAKEAVENVSALIKKYTGEDISKYDIHVQFVGAYEGVEGDSASVSIATAVISALENAEIDQTVALTGSLSVRGQVLPVGGVTAKIEAAAESGVTKVLIPSMNAQDVLLDSKYKDIIEVIPVSTLKEVLDNILTASPSKEGLLDNLTKFIPSSQFSNEMKKPSV
ncbi:MAG: ATP-dependent protease LonB [Candidatus Thermoplasmatota archaeon]|jgi:Lon-like ATP-dependent protease|nr:ATP-dependent protease LonB [Candidatus Thermoplasmatota archaeon]MEC7697466.1 ATP-dependent protease LonB [Candidatus Thermoplasmatota archaeon]MEC7976781.1 ATP-dependent protease LonB [Candidatus Thermoplasmatota archaeon]MEC8073975.1 ATP-dependent protease LonB [Candidatus Thermoplasmatota archaeon]MEC8076998.1 ATP-dependent protease LonB [Candidatus Thermoplasmatota archaeon]|tara:strand:- start:15 stop:1970 length:1956 start_codon:yes stop_codon:yes gene_type:complete